MDYPSPRGVHVPESFYSSDPDDPYLRPSSRRNRYSRSVHQTPRARDVAWIASPPSHTPQTPHVPPSPWRPPAPVLPSPVPRPPSAVPPSPVPTVGEHMTVDELINFVEPYPRPRRPGFVRSFWNGLKKLSGFQSGPSFPVPWPSAAVDIPRAPSEATQYVNPTSSGSGPTEPRSTTPYTSPYTRPANVGATLRASPARLPSLEVPPPITIVSPSPSIPSSPLPNSVRSMRPATPGPRRLSVGMPEPGGGTTEEGSQTLHEPVFSEPAGPPVAPIAIPVARSDEDEDDKSPVAPVAPMAIVAPIPQRAVMGAMPSPEVERPSSLTSTMARVRRFFAGLDGLPWVWDAQIADEYIPEMNPRSRLRTRVRQGADPSWYNERPEPVKRPEYWSEWDMWAKQSTAALWDGSGNGAGRVGWAGVGAGGGMGQGAGLEQSWGAVYPHGYTPVQPGLVYPSGYPPLGMVKEGQTPVLP